jgi:hypothetical protein
VFAWVLRSTPPHDTEIQKSIKNYGFYYDTIFKRRKIKRGKNKKKR